MCDERRRRSRRAAAQQQVDQSALPEVEQQEEEEHGGAGGEQQQQQQQQQQHQCHVRRTSAGDDCEEQPGSRLSGCSAPPPPPLQAAAAQRLGDSGGGSAAWQRAASAPLPLLERAAGACSVLGTYGCVRRGLMGWLRGPCSQCVLSVTLRLSIRTSKKESSDFRFQISDFRFQIPTPGRLGRETDFFGRFQISDLRSPRGTRSEISKGSRILNAQNTFQDFITDFCATQISDFRSQNWPDF